MIFPRNIFHYYNTWTVDYLKKGDGFIGNMKNIYNKLLIKQGHLCGESSCPIIPGMPRPLLSHHSYEIIVYCKKNVTVITVNTVRVIKILFLGPYHSITVAKSYISIKIGFTINIKTITQKGFNNFI